MRPPQDVLKTTDQEVLHSDRVTMEMRPIVLDLAHQWQSQQFDRPRLLDPAIEIIHGKPFVQTVAIVQTAPQSQQSRQFLPH